jgi:hypothetical protein
LPEGRAVTRDHARKKAIRARMAASGEPYSVAARKLAAAGPADDAAFVGEIIARAERTLAEPSSRIEFRVEWDFVRREPPQARLPGPVGRLARLAARAAWDRIAPGVDAAALRDMFTNNVGEGFLEPAVGRYQLDYGGYAAMCVDGKRFGGRSGTPLQPRHRQRRPPTGLNEPLGMLRALLEVTDARHIGDEAVRGTECRAVAVTAGSAELTVWVDDEHVRRVRSEEHSSRPDFSLSTITTLELWDFGVPVDSLDWSRLPSLRTPG